MLSALLQRETPPPAPPLALSTPAPEEPPAAPPPPARAASQPSLAASPPPASATPAVRSASSPLAAELNAPASDARHDVATLHAILRQYFRILHGRRGSPIGNDSDLVRVLTGHNPMKLAVLPPDHPAITADGRLRDRWGTPYFIHPRGNLAFEIRSAGPDRKLFTADDLVENPGDARTDLSNLPPEPEPLDP